MRMKEKKCRASSCSRARGLARRGTVAPVVASVVAAAGRLRMRATDYNYIDEGLIK